MQALTNKNLVVAKWILHYVKYTLDLGLTFHSSPSMHLTIFNDFDWANDPDDRRSTIDYFLFIGRNLVSKLSKKQAPFSQFSVKVEYRAIVTSIVELQWFRNLLHDLGIHLPEAPTILTSSKSTIFMVENLELDCHYNREFVRKWLLTICYTNQFPNYKHLYKSSPNIGFL